MSPPIHLRLLSLNALKKDYVIITLPVGPNDVPMAVRLLKFIAEINSTGVDTTPLYLCLPPSVDPKPLIEASPFTTTEVIKVTAIDERGWPIAPNAMFRSVCRHMFNLEKGHYLWLEPDCVPLASDWITSIAAEHAAKCSPKTHAFLGNLMYGKDGTAFISGVAVYHQNSPMFIPSALFAEKAPWDLVSGFEMIKHTAEASTIKNIWGNSRTEEPVVSLSDLDPAVKLFHRNKSGSLIPEVRAKLCIKKGTDFDTPTQTTSEMSDDEVCALTEGLELSDLPPSLKKRMTKQRGKKK